MNTLKNELQNLIFENESTCGGKSVKGIQIFLKRNARSSQINPREKYFKREEEIKLSEYISQKDLWYTAKISEKDYITEGAEQKVYRLNSQYLIKLNDGVFYLSWLDYFNSLLIHNYLFPIARYEILGFVNRNDRLFAVVKQRFIPSTEIVDLKLVSEFLSSNKFKKIRNNDYLNEEIGLILEDLHDENIISNNGRLYFIDSIFYLTDDFYLLK